MKKALALISVLALVSVAVADYTPVTAENPSTISGNKTFSGTVTISGATTVSGALAASSTITETATSTSVTNNQPVTVSAGCHVLNGIGQENNFTNTITLTAPAAAGQKVTLLVATASTNLVTIADSGTVAASGAILMDGNDSCTLQAVDTSTWVLVSESDN